MKVVFDGKWFLMKVNFDEKFFLMKMVLMNLYFTSRTEDNFTHDTLIQKWFVQ